MTAPLHVTAQNFEREVTHSAQPVLVDFWAEWCAPCRLIAPIVETLAEEYAGTLKVAKADVDQLPELADRFNVRSIPTLGLFVDGQLVKRIVGYVAKPELKKQIDALLRTLPKPGIVSAGA
jgi:thioredoxin 1